MIRHRPSFFVGWIVAGILAAALTAPALAQMAASSQFAQPGAAPIPTASTITTNPGVPSSSTVPLPSNPDLQSLPQTTLFPAVRDYGNIISAPKTSTMLTNEQDEHNRSLKEIMKPPVPVTFTPYSSENPYANENPYINQVLPSVDLNAKLHSNPAPVIRGPAGNNQMNGNGSNGANGANGANGSAPASSASSNLAAAIAEAIKQLKASGELGGSAPPADTWRKLPQAGVSADLKDVQKESILPPFVISAASRSLDLSRIWWSPELLSIRIGRPTGGEEGVVVPWRRSPAGFPAAILMARLPTIENRQVIIKQAVSMMWIDGSWVAEGSSMAVSLKSRDGDEETLITPADGQGMWRVRLTGRDSVEVWRWIAAALNGCRATLAEKLNNEELRQLLINSGEVVWRISPDKSLSKT